MYSTSPEQKNHTVDGSMPSQDSSQMSFVSSIAARQGKPLLGAGITITNQVVAQLVAQQLNCDFVMIDMEHSPISPETTTQIVHAVAAASHGRCQSLIRVPSSGVEWIKWALDSGAAGIIIPMVNKADEMKAILDRALYTPQGMRSFGPVMAQFAQFGSDNGVMSYFNKARRGEVAILPMIESKEGVINAKAIMGLEGVSGVFIGPFDLRLALGLPGGLDGSEPEFVQAVEKICVLGRRFNKVVGSMGIGEQLSRLRTSQGMKFLVTTIDYMALSRGIESSIRESEAGLDSPKL